MPFRVVEGHGLRKYSNRLVPRYVTSSPARLVRFKGFVEKDKIETKSLVCLDVSTRWNSMYLMLERSMKFEKVFERMEDDDEGYTSHFTEDPNRAGPPCYSDWRNASVFVQFLRVFYSITVRLFGSLYVMSNACFHDIAQVHTMLKASIAHRDALIGDGLPMPSFLNTNPKGKWWSKKKNNATDQKLDLEKYLADGIHDNDNNFDILAWGKVNANKYKILSLFAHDVLIVPVSIVASESAFSTGGRAELVSWLNVMARKKKTVRAISTEIDHLEKTGKFPPEGDIVDYEVHSADKDRAEIDNNYDICQDDAIEDTIQEEDDDEVNYGGDDNVEPPSKLWQPYNTEGSYED
ncbi:zinc finger BED domain-containing protein RICESLEEPER 2-like [Senna tora]|uniref:Zinc finger BED domain-containing protein RICESLEEPER 2-like n=1 Tax=Senna tora TaxID=362788 RepID=A0A834THV0_9FABA|nr:zinc finger BED domain-containing protein RICESLEEPER 2-like [Senna tora]